MSVRQAMRNAVIGVTSGVAGHVVMNRVTTRFYESESAAAKRQEKRVSPGISYNVAAAHLSRRFGLDLDVRQIKLLGKFFSYGLALSGGELYMLLRDRFGLNPPAAALTMATILFVGFDEGLTPAMGWSAPDPKYPIQTHLRGLVGHLSLGATIMATAEIQRLLADLLA